MKFKSVIVAVGLMLASAASQAHVAYEWVAIDNNSLPINFTARIEFDNGAVEKGSFNLRLEPGKAPVGDDGFILFSSTGEMRIGPNYSFPGGVGYLDINLSFVENNRFLTGSIRASNFSERVNLSSFYGSNPDPRVFTLYDTAGDGMLGCGYTPSGVCEGATGYFRLVSEPGSVALLGLGLAGALVARRRKRAE